MPLTDQQRLRLGTALIEDTDDLWPQGEPATPEWIRDHVDDILALLEQVIWHDGHDVRRLPRRLHWLLWLLDEFGAVRGCATSRVQQEPTER
jgi:hypothetical protein